MWKPPSLIDIYVRSVIDNVRYLGDVGEIDTHLLERILPHCTMEQLMHVEMSTKEKGLSPITDKLWKKFYELLYLFLDCRKSTTICPHFRTSASACKAIKR
ncbi:hypothetical protein CRYUN_Cryun34aG0102500 [Craigia yunnanensis]